MIYHGRLLGRSIHLRGVELADCTAGYVAWMNDKDVNRYMETRWERHSLETIQAYVRSMRDSGVNYHFAIIETASDKHIGNIKLGPINTRYRYADLSYFIGEKTCWHKGYASEAISLICRFGFEDVELHRIQAGVIAGNTASIKALINCGFRQEGREKEKYFLDGEYVDHLLFGLINEGK